MLFRDNPREQLFRLEDELLDDELEEILYGSEEDPEADWGIEVDEAQLPRGKQKKKKKNRRSKKLDAEDEARYMLLPKKKGIKGLVFLAFLEILAILAILGWWLQWLI